MTILTIEHLTAESFAPFGDVVDMSTAREIFDINEGNTVRYHDICDIDVSDGEVCTSIFNSTPVAYPFLIQVMERHPLGSQMFIPLSGHPYYVVVAAPGEFDPKTLRAFLATAKQSVNFSRNTWHHYSLPLVSISQFLVIDRKGDGKNLEEVTLKGDVFLPIYSPGN